MIKNNYYYFFYLSCFYILTVRFECKSERCSFSSVANGEQIIRQLPKFLQRQYPGYMTHRSEISKTVGDILRPCMQNSVGPTRFQKVLRELHELKHARSEFQLLNAAIFWGEIQKLVNTLPTIILYLPFRTLTTKTGIEDSYHHHSIFNHSIQATLRRFVIYSTNK